jgi:hypothetical protein
MATKIVEWDDFTGGYYVGASATKQPRNTFTGQNVAVAMDDATLIPMYSPATLLLSGTDVSGGVITNAGWTDVGPPAGLNGLTCFTAKTSSAAYLYAVSALGAVVRHTLTLNPSGGTLAGFQTVRPTLVSGDTKNDYVDVYVGGDYRQLIRYKLNIDGTVRAGFPTTIAINGMTATGDAQVLGTAVWGARLLAYGQSANLYFSYPPDATNNWATAWPSTNYIGIGYLYDNITAIVPRNYDLLIGKPSGWYVVTGVLNYSASVRQINNGLGILGSDPASEWNNQVVFNTDTGTIGYPVNLYTVNGARVQPMAFQRFAGNIQNLNLGKGPLGVLQVCHTVDDDTDVTGMIYLLNQQARWCRITIPTATSAATGDTVKYYPVNVTQSRTDFWSSPACVIMEHNVTDKKVAIQTLRIPTFEPGTDSAGNPATGTVLLADYMSQTPITVTDVYVEVELAELGSPNQYGGDGSINCAINMKFPPADLAFSVGNVSSTTMNAGNYAGSAIPGTGTRFMGRVFRFRPDNPGYGYGFEVQVNFAGMKVRRIMAVLREQM